MAIILKPGEAIETKYRIVDNQIRSMQTGEIVPFDEVVIFRARDNAFPQALEAYTIACSRLEAPPAHIAAAKTLLQRVQSWREQHLELCRLPGRRYTMAQNLMAIEDEKAINAIAAPASQCCGGGSCAGG